MFCSDLGAGPHGRSLWLHHRHCGAWTRRGHRSLSAPRRFREAPPSRWYPGFIDVAYSRVIPGYIPVHIRVPAAEVSEFPLSMITRVLPVHLAPRPLQARASLAGPVAHITWRALAAPAPCTVHVRGAQVDQHYHCSIGVDFHGKFFNNIIERFLHFKSSGASDGGVPQPRLP